MADNSMELVNPLSEWFENHEGRQIHKWVHYLDIYHNYFKRYRGTDVHIVEIGVANGGSIEMWKEYFGEKAKIFGVDLHEEMRSYEDEQTTIFIGDQADREFLRHLASSIPRIDILLDDGGHAMKQQIATFEELYPYIDEHGLYVCEDTHTSYWRKYGGGYLKPGTFTEYSKQFIDKLHAWHTPDGAPPRVDDFVRSTLAMHWYDSIVVLEKRPMTPPHAARRGQVTARHGAPTEGEQGGQSLRRAARGVRELGADRAADAAAKVREWIYQLTRAR